MTLEPLPRADEPIHARRNQRNSPLWLTHVLVGVFFAALVGFVFPSWLSPYEQPQRGGPEPQFKHIRAGDLTPLFSVWTQVAARSLFRDGEFPLWSDHIYSGEPFFSKPQIGVISLTTLLCVMLPAQVAATWTFLLHLWISGMAAYVCGLAVLGSAGVGVPTSDGGVAARQDPEFQPCLAAACGGVAFMLSNFMIEHAMIGHGPIVLVACWTPLVLWSLMKAFAGGDRPVRYATLAGVLVAVQLLAGGESIFLYNVIAGGLAGFAWIACGSPQQFNSSIVQPAMRRVRQLFVVAVVTGVVGFGLSAIKVLPGLALMPLSNRAGGLTLDDAAGVVIEFREPAVVRAIDDGLPAVKDIRSLFPVTLVVAAAGAFAALRERRQRWLAVAAILLVVVGILVAHSRIVFAVLWHVLPMFRYQRIPQRAMVLAYVGLSLLVTFGASSLVALAQNLVITLRMMKADRTSIDRPEAAIIARSVMATLVGCALVVVLAGESLIALPPLPPTADIRREVRENAILSYIARQEGRFRIHAIESYGRDWGIEHVTVPLGLSNFAGWDHLWLLEYLGAEGTVDHGVRSYLVASYEAARPTRFWGLMNVRFVTSTRPLDVPGLRLVAKFPPCGVCQPAKSAGPFLYENDDAMPRAWIAAEAIPVLGDRAERLAATYRQLDRPDFNPRHTVLVHTKEELPAAHDAAPRSVEPAGPSAPSEPTIEYYRGRSLRVRLAGQHGYLLLAEKFAHFSGWRANSAAGARPLLKANGVATAIPLDGSEDWIELTYWPTGMTAGLLATIVTLVLAPIIGCVGDRARTTA